MMAGISATCLAAFTVAAMTSQDTVCRFAATGSPEEQGWVATRSGTSPTAELVDARAGAKGMAWQVRDGSNEPGTLAYAKDISDEEWARLAAGGWKLTVTLQVVSCDVAANNEKLPESTAQLELVPGKGGKGIRLAFSLTGKEHQADGAATVVGLDGAAIHRLGRGYHTVEAMAPPAMGGPMEINVRIDGRSRYGGQTSAGKVSEKSCLRWGSFGADGTSVVNWREIRLEAMRESDTAAPGAKRESDYDFEGFGHHFGATFEIDAPQPISNLPLGKCAELRRWGTPVSLARPTLHNMDDYFEFSFALRRPPKYDYMDDMRVTATYQRDGWLAWVVLDGEFVRQNGLPIQYRTSRRGGGRATARDVAAEIRERLQAAVEAAAGNEFLKAMPRAVEECIVAVDTILVGHR